MNISLTPELERFIQDRVNAGLYGSASEVVRDGLRLLKEKILFNREQFISELHQFIDKGLQDTTNGNFLSGDEAYTDSILQVDKLQKMRN